MRLDGSNVIITGSGSGIGRAAVMRANGGGAIVVTASVAGIVAFEGNPIYTMTKQAVTGFVRAVAPSLTGDVTPGTGGCRAVRERGGPVDWRFPTWSDLVRARTTVDGEGT